MTCFVQYVPYRLRDESWENGARERLAETVIDTIDEYAPNFRESVIERQVLTPYDLEQRFGLIGGNIFQGEMSLDQLFSFRPSPELSGYRTPVKDLYLCGSGTHPGGGVMGIPGLERVHSGAQGLREQEEMVGEGSSPTCRRWNLL